MYGHQGGKEESGMNWKIGADVQALLIPCVKWVTDEKPAVPV